MALSQLLLLHRVFGTVWGHPPQASVAPRLSPLSALIAHHLLPAASSPSPGAVWSRRAMMKLLPVAPLLLLLTALEARPKPAGEPWTVGIATGREKGMCQGSEALRGQLAA